MKRPAEVRRRYSVSDPRRGSRSRLQPDSWYPVPMRKLLWILVALIGAFAVGGIALHRGETINAMWIVVAAVCVYAIGYRFYSAWVAARVLSARRDARDAGRAPEQRPRLRADASLDRVRPSLRGDRRSRPADRPDARGAVRLPARHAVDPGRRGARRLRAGHDDPVPVDASQRPQPRPDGARRARPGRRLRRDHRHADDHDHPDRRARPGRRQRDEAQPVGHLDGVRDHSDRDPGRAVPAQHPPGPRARSLADRRRAVAARGGRRRLGRCTIRRCARCSTSTASRSRGSSSATASSPRCCRCGCCSRRATTCRRS